MIPEKAALVNYRMSKAKETLAEVDSHIGNEYWNTAVNRVYYACFYAVTALLVENGIEAKTHSGARQMFGLHFVKPGIVSAEIGEFYTDIFDMRHTSDYADFIELREKDVVELLPLAIEMMTRIEELISSKR